MVVGKVASVPSPLTYCAVVPAPVTAIVPLLVSGEFVTVNAAVSYTHLTLPTICSV